MSTITWDDVQRADLRVGRIVAARPLSELFPAVRKPAFVLEIDFGPDIGMRTSSAQLTDRYTVESLVGRLVVAVLNLPPKRIGPLLSQCLVTGFHDAQGHVALCVPDADVPLGTRLA